MRLAPLIPILLASCGGTVTGDQDGQAPNPFDECKHDAPVARPCGNKSATITSSPASCGVTMSGEQSADVCTKLCGTTPCFANNPTDLTQIQCGPNTACTGRRPEGLAPLDAPENIAEYFATMAALEAASVDAFAIMERELEAFGAPKRLVQRARRAARDERRHAKIVGKLAKRFGADAKAPVIAATGSRSLEAAALENAVEGCVRETWGAVAGAWQARASEDEDVRSVMDDVARDEVRHAELSWAVHAWAMKRLDGESRSRIREAMRSATEQLRAEAKSDPTRELVRTAGLPRGKEALALLEALDERVWRLEIDRGSA